MSLNHISTLTPTVRRQILGSILSNATIADVLRLAGYEQPDRRGFMRCPIHSEQSPSFHATASGKGWRCFGCGRKGGVFDLVVALGIAQDRAGAAQWLESVLR